MEQEALANATAAGLPTMEAAEAAATVTAAIKPAGWALVEQAVGIGPQTIEGYPMHRVTEVRAALRACYARLLHPLEVSLATACEGGLAEPVFPGREGTTTVAAVVHRVDALVQDAGARLMDLPPRAATTRERAFIAAVEAEARTVMRRGGADNVALALSLWPPLIVDGAWPCGLTAEEAYLDVRNHILLRWAVMVRVGKPLLFVDAVSGLPDLFVGFAAAVFDFLEGWGRLNVGAAGLPRSVYAVGDMAMPGLEDADALGGNVFGDESVEEPRTAPSNMPIVIIGAGMAGISAARHLKRFGFDVTILEGRDRLGGRMYTERHTLSCPVDLGAMITTGHVGNPVHLLGLQLGLEPHWIVASECPLLLPLDPKSAEEPGYSKIPREVDTAVERVFNDILEMAEALREVKPSQMAPFHLKPVRNGYITAEELSKAAKFLMEAVAPGEEHTDTWDAPLSDAIDIACHILLGSSLGIAATPAVRAVLDRWAPGGAGYTGTEREPEGDGPAWVPPAPPASERFAVLADRPEFRACVLHWHVANLEYGCAAPLSRVSLRHWDQDDIFGTEGVHSFVKAGYSSLVEGLAHGLPVHLNKVVMRVDHDAESVRVTTSDGAVTEAAAAVVTLPLGVLQAEAVQFDPPLPEWKAEALRHLGSGLLNKVILQFPTAFWRGDDSTDGGSGGHGGAGGGDDAHGAVPARKASAATLRRYADTLRALARYQLDVGACAAALEATDGDVAEAMRRVVAQLEDGAAHKHSGAYPPQGDMFGRVVFSAKERGEAYMFWSLDQMHGTPVLVCMVAGDAAHAQERDDDDAVVQRALAALQTMFPRVPNPDVAVCTRWASDPFSMGSYSHIAIGGSGDDYDAMSRPVERLFFAGEATSRYRPTTVAGAFETGVREAVRIAGRFGRTRSRALCAVVPETSLVAIDAAQRAAVAKQFTLAQAGY